MTFRATVLQVLVASPSDTERARSVVHGAIASWNDLNAEALGVVLLPLMWETSATPELGDRPQAIINRQLVDKADLLVGTFWTRVGTPTGESVSGTVEEIERFIGTGRPVLLYFSKEPAAPDTLDAEQLAAVRDFKREIQRRGLAASYDSTSELGSRLMADLTRRIRDLADRSVITTAASGDGASGVPENVEPLGQVAEHYRIELRAVVVRYQTEWMTLVDGLHIEEARRLMALFAQELSQLVAAVATVLDAQDSYLYTRLQLATQQASTLGRFRVLLDGGRSWNQFVETVDKVFSILSDLTGQEWTGPIIGVMS